MDDTTPGPGVDRYGNPVIDPTKNVLDLVAAAIQRQDDLREADSRALRDISQLRADHARELATKQSEHTRDMRQAEAARLDAIRLVDVAAVQRAAEVQAEQATALAMQVAASAEAMRNQVAAAATAQSIALSAAIDPIKTDIADLRRAQYEAQGSSKTVVETRERGASVGMWVGLAVSMMVFLLGVIVFLTQ